MNTTDPKSRKWPIARILFRSLVGFILVCVLEQVGSKGFDLVWIIPFAMAMILFETIGFHISKLASKIKRFQEGDDSNKEARILIQISFCLLTAGFLLWDLQRLEFKAIVVTITISGFVVGGWAALKYFKN